MPTLQFKGKTFVQNHHLAVPYHELIPQPKKSMTEKCSLHDNLIVHGDNLLALKALLPTYAGKVKCIYIDPPYNTGNEGWCYNDNVNSPMIQDWLGKVVDKDDLTRHDKWLCMMTPRLKLLRELLREDGAIFISIDDNEIEHLKLITNEIFGEENFVANFIWNHRKSSQNDIDISLSHNYTLCYAKKRDAFIVNRMEVDDTKFCNPDNDSRGDWVADPMDAPGVRENLQYKIVNPNTKESFLPPSGRHWRFTEDKFKTAIKENRIVFGKSGKSKPQYKRFKTEALDKGTSTFTIWDDVDTATVGTQEVMEIFGGEKAFPTPKPVNLLKRILSLSTSDDDIVLDSFAGSGTTAHATLALNKDDGGNRKYVLVETEDYADKVTAERVRRISKGIKSASDENLKKGLGGTFSYFELGEPIEMEAILDARKLPSYEDLARYVYYTATGEDFNPEGIDEKKNYIGKSKDFHVWLFYQPDMEYLKQTALTLEIAKKIGKPKDSRKNLVFAPTKYLDTDYLLEYRIEFCQLPFEIYKLKK